jgi:hypothetical protein
MQTNGRIKIRSVSDGSAWKAVYEMQTKQTNNGIKIRSVSDGSAWGWGPTRIKR